MREDWSWRGNFLKAAFKPAVTYESDVPEGIQPFLWKTVKALWLTVRYAVAAMSLALVLGLVLGFFGARSWWPDRGAARGWRRVLAVVVTSVLVVMRWSARIFSSVIRSVHEMLWALLFLTALGTSPLAAVVAIALPYGGTLAKVFSEMLDEQDESAMEAIRASGVGAFASWLVGIVTRAVPDLITYLLYRLECAVRSSAVIGFLGIPTMGYHLAMSY